MGRWTQDWQYVFRSLAKHKMASVVAIVSLAISIGPNAALFSIMDGVFLRSGFDRIPESVLGMMIRNAGKPEAFSLPEYRDVKESNHVFSHVAARYDERGNVTIGGATESLFTSMVSNDYFTTMGARAQIGRLFESSSSHRRDAVPVLISDSLWRRKFSGSPDVLGKAVIFNRRSVVIVGVLEPSFRGSRMFITIDIWLPLDDWIEVDPDTRRLLQPREIQSLKVVGKLRPGVTIEQARADMRGIASGFTRDYPAMGPDRSIVVWSLRDDERNKNVGVTLIVIFLSGMVLLLACTNVCTMLLARFESRRFENSTRLAMGATVWDLFRLLLIEAIILSVSASLLGLVLADWLLALFDALKPVTVFRTGFSFAINVHVIVYTMVLAVMSTLVFALTPLWKSKPRELVSTLNESSDRGGVRRFSRFAILVGFQITISQVLLCGAGLLVRSYLTTTDVDPGFDSEKNVLMISVTPSLRDAARGNQQISYYELSERLAVLPGVRQVSFINSPPLSGSGGGFIFPVKTQSYSAPARVRGSTVGLGYFRLMGTRILHGRGFERGDLGPLGSVVINESMARLIFPDISKTAEIAGRSFRSNGNTFQIIGISENGKYRDLHESPTPHAFFLAPESTVDGTTLLIETLDGPKDIAAMIRHRMQTLAPDIWIVGITTLKQHVRLTTFLDESMAVIVLSMGVLALLLAGIGLYGLTAFWIEYRMQEIGIRISLGATRQNVIFWIENRTMRPVVIGVCLGTIAAFVIGPVIAHLLFGIGPYDPIAVIGSALFTVVVSFGATVVPAMRAGTLDPTVMLRHE